MKRFLILLLLISSLGLLSAQNITDLAVLSDRSASQGDLDDWTVGPALDDSVFLHPDRIRYDSRCLQIEGHDVFLLSGTFHYFRTPEPLWRDRLEKIRAAGFNCVETYVPWNWHEREMPLSPDDFSKVDLSELDHFLTLAEEVGLYAIVRPGPYICAEWSGGGFPQWIMRKRPERTLHEVWLQSMDPTFLAWNAHWYDAVCRVVAPHQLTRKAVGGKGVVLVQVENEFNRIKWFPRKEKRAYLEHMAQRLRQGGIDVPLISCWTDEARNATGGPLNGVVDMVNSYPRWQIRKGFGRLINQQLKSQPGKPLISGELQGGWSSDLSTPLSWDMDGQSPAQTQNITLYALQRGFCALNFYMLVGGTNFDDWAARNQTATYDFAAAIGEDGTLNERYFRLQALAEFIREHGTRIARSRIEPVAYTSTDSLVELLVRRHPDGTRYLFVRTEEHTRAHKGSITIHNSSTSEAAEASAQFTMHNGLQTGWTIDFDLEPFGSRVAVLPPVGRVSAASPLVGSVSGASPLVGRVSAASPLVGSVSGGFPTGPLAWFPRDVEHMGGPAAKHVVARLTPHPVKPTSHPKPHFTPLEPGQTVDDLGHYSRHPLLYKVRAKTKAGGLLTVARVGKNRMNRTEADPVFAFADDQLLPACAETDSTISFLVPRGTRSLLFLYDSRGLHHHTNLSVERNWRIGPESVTLDGKPVALAFADLEREQTTKTSASPYCSLFTSDFSMGNVLDRERVGRAFYLRLRHTSDGFVYLNGHCLGRCYEAGPQTEYYLPECWLHTDGKNRITVSLMPSADGAEVSEMTLVAVP